MLSSPPISRPSIPESRRSFALTLSTRTKNPIQLACTLYLSPSLPPHATLSGNTAEEVGVSPGMNLLILNRWREHCRGLGLPDRPYPPHAKVYLPIISQFKHMNPNIRILGQFGVIYMWLWLGPEPGMDKWELKGWLRIVTFQSECTYESLANFE